MSFFALGVGPLPWAAFKVFDAGGQNRQLMAKAFFETAYGKAFCETSQALRAAAVRFSEWCKQLGWPRFPFSFPFVGCSLLAAASENDTRETAR